MAAQSLDISACSCWLVKNTHTPSSRSTNVNSSTVTPGPSWRDLVCAAREPGADMTACASGRLHASAHLLLRNWRRTAGVRSPILYICKRTTNWKMTDVPKKKQSLGSSSSWVQKDLGARRLRRGHRPEQTLMQGTFLQRVTVPQNHPQGVCNLCTVQAAALHRGEETGSG